MTLEEAREEAQSEGYVMNCKALSELGGALMVTEGLQNQLNLANQLIAHAEKVRLACITAIAEEGKL